MYKMGLLEENSPQRKLKELFAKAAQGDAKAQFNLGMRYEYGNGVKSPTKRL
jgi:TPR repeat protein